MEIHRSYFPFLDGVRGLTAIYVVIFHVVQSFKGGVPAWLGWVLRPFQYGHSAVGIFIVVSGWCLALPLLRSATKWSVRDGLHFLGRRSHRLLPPYYFALGLTLCSFIVSSQGVAFLRGERDGVWLANFEPGNLLTHALLVHNWSSQWALALNPPFWSIGTELQIYIVHAFVLGFFIVRRDWGKTYAACFVLTILAILIRGGLDRVLDCCPWYLFLFSFGAHSALSMGSCSCGKSILWVAVGGGFAIIRVWMPDRILGTAVGDLAVGGLTVGALLLLANGEDRGIGRVILAVRGLLETGFLRWLGGISYSVYLIHTPVLAKLRPLIDWGRFPPVAALLFTLFVNVPIVLCIAYAFHHFCEKPFLNRRSKSLEAGGAIKAEVVH